VVDPEFTGGDAYLTEPGKVRLKVLRLAFSHCALTPSKRWIGKAMWWRQITGSISPECNVMLFSVIMD